MITYAYLLTSNKVPIASDLHQIVKAILDNVDAVTVAGHTVPFVVFVRVRRELTEKERTLVGEVLQRAAYSV